MALLALILQLNKSLNGTIVTFMEKSTFKAYIDIRGSVPLSSLIHHHTLLITDYFGCVWLLFMSGAMSMILEFYYVTLIFVVH